MSDLPADPFEFFRRLWAPMAGSAPGLHPGMMFPTADVGEIEKRISELKSVENWLSLNLETVRTMVQGLEAQRATLSAFQSMNAAAAQSIQAASQSADPSSSQTSAPRRRKR